MSGEYREKDGVYMSELTTKEKLQYAALDFFSTKGYDATTVDEIAESIGMKGPVIYKYFKGKEDLLYSLYTVKNDEYEKKMGINSDFPFWIHSGSELKQFTMHQLNYTITEKYIVKFRRMCAINQFRDKSLSLEMTRHSYDNIVNLHIKIFKGMMELGALEECDPRLLAIEYTSPITVLMQICDREPEKKEELMKIAEEHIDFFIQKFCKK